MLRSCILVAAAGWVIMGEIQNMVPAEYARGGATCNATELRGLKTFLTHGGLIRVEGENQYQGQSVILRQFEPQHQKAAKNGVSLAAVCHPTTQNRTLALDVNDAHGVYIRRIASPRRTLPTVSVFTRTGTLPATLGNLETVCSTRPAQSTEVSAVHSWMAQ